MCYPKGLMRIRHFGFLANRCRAERIAQIRAHIDAAAPSTEPTEAEQEHACFEGYPCPKCHPGRLRVIAALDPKRDDGGGARKT